MRTERLDLPGYEVLDVLGQGGFATVYRARQLAVGREVALKVDSRLLTSARDRQRFLREVTAAGQLSGHPHVVAVYDAGVLGDGRPYMVLELCPGGSLGDRLRRGGPFPAREARDIGVRIADALAAAHAAGVLHRDIKPGNIMIDRYGGVALADFGLAAMPRPGHELSVTREALTPAYAPPEAFRLAEPTPAGDVYSLAATVYALVQGRPPHYPEDGSLSIAELITRHDSPVPDLPGVSPALTGVLRQGMAADPARRPASAGMLRDALAAVDLPEPADAVPVTANPDGPRPRSARTSAQETSAPPEGSRHNRRRPRLVLAAAALAAVAVLGTTAVLAQEQRASRGKSGAPSAPPTGTLAAGAGASTAGTGFDVPTTAGDCPAAAVTGLNARCTTTAECWGGMVAIAGNVTVNRADCLVEHPWETFAIAPLPPDAMTADQHELENSPAVRRLCSLEVMAQSRRGKARSIAPARWTVDVLPPSQTQFAAGVRVMRCVATVTGEQSVADYFRPRT